MGEIYSNRSREFRFEYKRFTFEVDNGGSMGIITETNRQRSYTIRIDFGGMFWLMEGLYSSARGSGESKFFQKYQASYGLFVMEKYSNRNGSFIRLLELQRGMLSNTIILPAGNRGEGWRGVADRLKQMMFSPSPDPKYVPVKNARVQVKNDNISGRGGNKQHRSYAEALKYERSYNYHPQVKHNVGDEAVVEWSKVVVCTRESIWDSRHGIQRAMNKFYRTRLVLRPFQADKALFVCDDEKSAEFFRSRSLLFLEGPYVVRLQRWNDREVYQNNKITCTGGWITVEGLPINLWKNSIFEAIGRRCGGLIDIDVKTSKLQKLFLARIKVKGRTSGFIPASLRINTSSESFLVRLRAISKLRWDRVPAEDPSPINMFAEEDIVVVDTKNDEDDMLTSFGKVEGGNHGVRAKTEPEQMKPGKVLSEGHEGNWLGRIRAKKIEDFKVWEIKRRKTITQPRSRCITGSCVLRCENDDIESVKSFCDKEGQNNFSDSERGIMKTPKEGTQERNNRDSAESGELMDKRFGQIYTRRSNKKLIREIDDTTEIPECFEQAIGGFSGTEAEDFGNILSDFSENESQEDEDRESSSSEVVK
ncbi:hypothetical protein LguiA_027407 [Lonicera macranthoides]